MVEEVVEEEEEEEEEEERGCGATETVLSCMVRVGCRACVCGCYEGVVRNACCEDWVERLVGSKKLGTGGQE